MLVEKQTACCIHGVRKGTEECCRYVPWWTITGCVLKGLHIKCSPQSQFPCHHPTPSFLLLHRVQKRCTKGPPMLSCNRWHSKLLGKSSGWNLSVLSQSSINLWALNKGQPAPRDLPIIYMYPRISKNGYMLLSSATDWQVRSRQWSINQLPTVLLVSSSWKHRTYVYTGHRLSGTETRGLRMYHSLCSMHIIHWRLGGYNLHNRPVYASSAHPFLVHCIVPFKQK